MELLKSELVYLDSNVYIDIDEGRRPELKSYLLEQSLRKSTLFPFSSALINELTSFRKTNRCIKRLNFLSKVSSDLYFISDIRQQKFCIESPYNVHKIIFSHFAHLNLSKLFTKLVLSFLVKKMRADLELAPNVLNNKLPSDAIIAIDEALLKYAIKSNKQYFPLVRQIKLSRERAIKDSRKLWNHMGVSEEQMLHNHDIKQAFILLELHGYHPDKAAVYEKGSRYIDAEHLSAASHCDFLVTRDKGMKRRAEAVYQLASIRTQVLSTDEYEAKVL
ncbi:hypothetical protein [uncultured Paraglaciecola sp.]|uniref:hypothetical protein n=1 Tax=uncultured Paraglaciecola sp. TaxID=1765024 RepID=UPI00259215F8|nr:hypothetical protein [uncultured Paraglaciecola sp.]